LIDRRNSGTTITQAIYYRMATSADASATSYAWGFSASSQKAAGAIIAYSGVDYTVERHVL